MAISIANFLLTWGVALYMYLANKNKATNERITSVETDFGKKLQGNVQQIKSLDEDIVAKHEIQVQRITKLEAIAQSAPSHADLAKLYDSVNALASTVNQLVGENRGQSDTLRLILNQITEKGMR